MNYKHPITKEVLKDAHEFTNVFYNEIIDPFEAKTGLKVCGWSDSSISVSFNRETELEVRLPIWFALMILNDWKVNGKE